MNSEYVWWVIVLILVGAGAIAFLALGRIPEIEDEPEPDVPDQVEADPHTASRPTPDGGRSRLRPVRARR